jgi:hypothetical protein
MPRPRRTAPRRLGEAMRRKLEVTSAMAWEALVDTHVEQAGQFVELLAEFWAVEEALVRYLREMDLDETMATAIRPRVLIESTDPDSTGAAAAADAGAAPVRSTPAPRRSGAPGAVISTTTPPDDGNGDGGWNLLRTPQLVVRDVMRRQRRNEEVHRILQLSLARAEENVIRTHVENAIGFVALLEEQMPLDRAVQQYLGAVGLAGGRAQTVFQRTMARLADVHLG